MRVPREVEIRGLDIFKHGEAAYPVTAYGHGWDAVKPVTREELRRSASFDPPSNFCWINDAVFLIFKQIQRMDRRLATTTTVTSTITHSSTSTRSTGRTARTFLNGFVNRQTSK